MMIDFSKQPVLLAPLARITILPFRILCREAGADATVTEMISAKSIMSTKEYFSEKIAFDPREQPAGIQLVGSDPRDFKQAVTVVSELDYYNWVDINFGCPSPKVTGSKMGADLLKDITRAEKIVASTVKNTHLPVSIKIRLGPEPSKNVYKEFVKIAREYDLAFVTVHARYTCSTYKEPAHWDKLAEIK
ncbi:MAG: tRNA dihydrouridine synthase, partial [Candidatus Hodarchaeales archaeon]